MQMENEIPKSKYKQFFIQQIKDAVVLTDHRYRVTAWNKAAENLFGYQENEVLGNDIALLIPSSDNASAPPPLSIKSNGFTQGITEQITRNKQKIPVYASLHAMEENSALYGFLIIFKPIEKGLPHHDGSVTKSSMALQQSEERHRLLFQHLQNVREIERTHIAREIHDELGQQLTILKMDISWLHKKLQANDDTAVSQKMEETLQMLNETIKTIRRIATELRPSMLDDLGLIAAMEWQSNEFENRSGIKINFQSNVPQLPVSSAVSTSLFRIYQEALTNIGRHAEAKNVFCFLQLQNDELTLTIKDDGRGFDMHTPGPQKTLGLLGMKERALLMGGRFDINSAPGKGTTIVVTTCIVNIQ